MDFANNGDDCLLFLSRKDLHKIGDLEAYFVDFGFKIVREKPVAEVEHIEFCQCKPMLVNGIWRMVRNIKTCLAKDVTAVSLGHDVKQYRRWLKDVSNSGLSFSSDVPVLGSFYRMLGRFGVEGGSYTHKNAQFNAYATLSRNVRGFGDSPDDYGRYSFWMQTGIHPQGQIELEHYFDSGLWGDDNRLINRNLNHIIKNGT